MRRIAGGMDLATVFDAFHHGIATVFASAYQSHHHFLISLDLGSYGLQKLDEKGREKKKQMEEIRNCVDYVKCLDFKNRSSSSDSSDV